MTNREEKLGELAAYLSQHHSTIELEILLDAYVHAKVEEMVISDSIMSLQKSKDHMLCLLS